MIVNANNEKNLAEIEPSKVATDVEKASTIFSENLLTYSEMGEKPPIIVCGLPRSGSSLLSDLITQTGAYYVFDDLYLKRKVDELGCYGNLDARQISQLLAFLGWQIRARIRFKPYSTPMMLQDDVDKMNNAIIRAYKGVEVDWIALQKEWLIRLAMLNGCKGWGFNYPAAVRDINSYDKMYPSSLFVFLHRSPDEVMSSYKYMPKGHNDGDPERYHPIVYAVYWKVAAKNFFKFKKLYPERVVDVRFSNMIKSPFVEIEKISIAFNFKVFNNFELVKANSSFNKKKKKINGFEYFLLEKIAGSQLQRLGYKIEGTKITISDYFDFLRTSFRCALFHLIRKKD